MITPAFKEVLQLSGLVPDGTVAAMSVPAIVPCPVTLARGRRQPAPALRFAAPFGLFLLVAMCRYLLMTSVVRQVPRTLLLMLFIQPWLLARAYAIWRTPRQTLPTPASAGRP